MNLPLTSPNCLYICHCCLNYKTTKKSDMIKHINKKKQCNITYELKNNTSKEELYKLSLNRRFYFLFDYNKLFFTDFIFIINHFHENINYIKYEDIIKNHNQLNNNQNNNNNIQNNNIQNNNIQNNNIQNNEINNIQNNNILNNNNINNNNINNKFQCLKCNKVYKSKQSLIIHLKNKTICLNNQLINNMINGN